MTEEKIIAQITQRYFPFRTQTLTLYEDRVELFLKSPLEYVRVPYYLNRLKQDPDIILRIPFVSTMLSLFSLLLAVFLYDNFVSLYLSPAIATSFLSFLYFAFRAICRTGRLIVFYYTTEPVLFLMLHGKDVQSFIDNLRIQRERCVEKYEIGDSQDRFYYIDEIDRFGRLLTQGVINQIEFDAVKAKLLDLRPKRIGFKDAT